MRIRQGPAGDGARGAQGSLGVPGGRRGGDQTGGQGGAAHEPTVALKARGARGRGVVGLRRACRPVAASEPRGARGGGTAGQLDGRRRWAEPRGERGAGAADVGAGALRDRQLCLLAAPAVPPAAPHGRDQAPAGRSGHGRARGGGLGDPRDVSGARGRLGEQVAQAGRGGRFADHALGAALKGVRLAR